MHFDVCLWISYFMFSHHPYHYLQIIREVSCGAVHVVALSEEGLLQAWGNSVIAFLYLLFSF